MSEKKAAIITGGSRGIGRSIAIELAAAGYFVYFTYVANDIAAKETLDLITAAGGEGKSIKFDVRDQQQSLDIIEDISKSHTIEILINNAGIAKDGLFVMMKPEDWSSVIDTTLSGFYNMTKPVLKKMIRKKKGSIVTVSSFSGLIGNRGQANYSAAKAAVIAASKSIAKEMGRLGIRINVVAPGLIETELIEDAPIENIKQMIPMSRIGQPEEVAKVVKFLCSEDASYITGEVISINGGMTI